MVFVGLGGGFAEALADTALRLAPLTRDQASEMLGSLRAGQVLDGFRDIPPVDRQAVLDVILAVSGLMCAHPEIAEIEINPLRVNEHGALALDALLNAAI